MKKILLFIVFFLFSLIFSVNSQTLSFTEVAQQLGVQHIDYASGAAAWGDFDRDGDSDLYVTSLAYSVTGPQNLNRLFRNDLNITGKFVDIATSMGIDEPNPDSRGASWCDFNGDGLLDLYVASNSYSYPDSSKLFVNMEEYFMNQAGALGISNWGHNSMGVWGDYDGDGDQDLYICVFSWVEPMNLLFRNDGNRFTNVSDVYKLYGDLNSYTATWVDFDNDGDLDLSVSNGYFPNNLYENRINEDNTFVDVAPYHSIADTGAAGIANWFDYDNDGDLDLFIVNYISQQFPHLYPSSKLYRNDLSENDNFVDVTTSLNLPDKLSGYSASSGDYDNDADLDLYVAVRHGRNLFFRNDIDQIGSFTEIAGQLQIDDSLDSRGTVNGDYDNDGDLDIYVINDPRQICRMYRNDLNSENYLKVRLADENGHLTRQGSRVLVYHAGTDALAGMRVVDGGGNGGLSQGEYDCHFGLDPNQAYDVEAIFTTRTSGQNHVFNKHNRPELGGVIPTQIGHFLEIRDSVVTVTSLRPGTKPEIIEAFKLYQNYPNPFNATTTIPFQIEKRYQVKLVIYDLTGKEVITLTEKQYHKGFYEITWNGKNEKGGDAASGVYICHLLLDNKLQDVRKLFLIR